MSAATAMTSPFGGAAKHVLSMSTAELAARYREKCGADIAFAFKGIEQIDLFECEATGYRFWRPIEVAGDEQLYQTLAAHWKHYYRETRWEYAQAARLCAADARVLEVGCGRGYFLKMIEDHVKSVEGVELNTQAVKTKVTRAEVHTTALADLVPTRSGTLDVIYAFQVIEHVCDPRQLIVECAALLAPGGRLVLSTPNDEAAAHRSLTDPFNMPPHHMGHFTVEVFRRVAALCGFSLDKAFVQHKKSAVSSSVTGGVTDKASEHFAFKAASALSQVALDAALWISGEPGDNLLVSLCKQAGSRPGSRPGGELRRDSAVTKP